MPPPRASLLRPPRPRRAPAPARAVVLALALALLPAVLPACQCPRLTGGLPETAAAAQVEAGAYARDPRVTGLLTAWPQVVGRVLDRLELVLGLRFEGEPPEVLLAPLGDETRDVAVRTRLVDGVRIPSVTVNLERLAAGRDDPDEVLGRGLAVAALEVAAARTGAAVPPWLSAAVGAASGGALQERVEQLVREDVLAGRRPGARVDPADPRQAGSTGLAVLLLLLERGGPEQVRRFLEAVLDGDAAEEALQRLLRVTAPPWGEARRVLDAQLAEVDATPYRTLAAAEQALAETGRAGLLAALPSGAPSGVEEEVAVLAARAALGEGDLEAARAALRSLPADAARRLRDPREVHVLRVRTEAGAGGDPAEAARWLDLLGRDYPRTGQADRLRAELRLPDDPRSTLEALRRRATGPALAALEIEAVARYVDLLLRDQRSGEAQRVLDQLGERATAPELEALARAVAAAEREPSPEARAEAGRRVEAWLRAPSEAAWLDVRESGAAAADVLAARLSEGRAGPRSAAVALLGATAGPAAVARLAAAWERDPALLPADLEALCASVRLPELEVWVRTRAEAALRARDPDPLFARLRLDLRPEYVRDHPDLVRDLFCADFATRRRAVAALSAAGEAQRAPALVARLLADPSPVLRRDAVALAGEARFEALLRAALDDPAPGVRRAAAAALRGTQEPASVDALLARLARDAASPVRTAAGLALLESVPDDPRLVPALLQALTDEDAAQRNALLGGLARLPEERLLAPTLEALEQEARQRDPHASALAIWFRLLERVSGRDLGWYPGLSPDETRALLARARERLLGARAPRSP